MAQLELNWEEEKDLFAIRHYGYLKDQSVLGIGGPVPVASITEFRSNYMVAQSVLATQDVLYIGDDLDRAKATVSEVVKQSLPLARQRLQDLCRTLVWHTPKRREEGPSDEHLPIT